MGKPHNQTEKWVINEKKIYFHSDFDGPKVCLILYL